MSLAGSTNEEKFDTLSHKKYKDQAVWFMNAYWDDIGSKHGEDIWEYVGKFSQLDSSKGPDGCQLDEMKSHRLLEAFGEPLTVVAFRKEFREIDLDFNKQMSMSEFLLYKYKEHSMVKMRTLVNATQGGNEKEIKEAQALLEEAQRALSVARSRAEASAKAEQAAKTAEKENKRALEVLHAEEEAYNGKIAALEKKIEDPSLGIVKKGRAKAELASLKAEDPLPLRRAKINQSAAVRKSERAAKAATKAREEAEKALKDAEDAFKAAEDFLEEVKMRTGSAAGGLWWIERELHEAKKYLPGKKGGITATRGARHFEGDKMPGKA